jgi:hypothetical protein
MTVHSHRCNAQLIRQALEGDGLQTMAIADLDRSRNDCSAG